MPQFLTTSGTLHLIEDIIIKAKSDLVLITPYLKLTRILSKRLTEANRRGVRIRLLYGINQLYGWEAGNYNVYVPRNDYQTLMRQLNQVPGAFALFAHPHGDYGNLAGNATFSPTADSAVVGVPLRSGPATSTSTLYNAVGTNYESTYRAMLAKGCHVGMSLDHDNHNTTFGRTTQGRTVVLAPALTEANLLQALRARRFYGSDDWNARVTLTLNGQPMGAMLQGAAAAVVSVTYADPDNEPAASITLLRGVPGSGVVGASIATSTSGAAALTYTDPVALGSAYYYAVIVQADGDRIVTSPIWYTRAGALAQTPVRQPVSVEVFPNPVAHGQAVTVAYSSPHAMQVQVQLLDGIGRTMPALVLNVEQGAGSHTVEVATTNLTAGLYTLRIVSDGVSTYRKLLITE